MLKGNRPQGNWISRKESAMALADFIKVQKFLGGISYPATRQQLVEHARGNHAIRANTPPMAARPRTIQVT